MAQWRDIGNQISGGAFLALGITEIVSSFLSLPSNAPYFAAVLGAMIVLVVLCITKE